MAKCSVCGKAAHFGKNVSHSHRKSNRMWKSNIKSVKCKVNGAAKKMYVCTSCLKSGKVERAQFISDVQPGAVHWQCRCTALFSTL